MKNRALLFVVLLFGILLHLLYLKSPIDRDAGFFMTAGRMITQGKLLYQDIFDFKPPGMHYTAALIYMVVGNSFIGFRLFTLSVNVVSAFVVYLISVKLWDEKTGVLASLLFLIGIPLFDGTDFFSEVFLVMFSGVGVLFYLNYLKSGEKATLLLSGLSFGVSILYKQVGLLILLGVALHYLISHKKSGAVVVLILASIIPVVLSFTYLTSKGILHEAVGSMFSIVGRYKPNSIWETVEYSYQEFMAYPLLWILALTSIIVLIKETKIRSTESVIPILFLISLTPTFFKQFPHYYLQALFFGSIPAAKTFFGLLDVKSVKPETRTPYYVTLAVVLLLIVPTVFQLALKYHYIGKYRILDKYIEVSDYVKRNTKHSEKILVITKEAQIYFLSERNPPTKYLHLDYSDYYNGIEENIISNTKKEGVRYVIVIENPYLDEYASRIHKEVINNGILEETIKGIYPIKVYKLP